VTYTGMAAWIWALIKWVVAAWCMEGKVRGLRRELSEGLGESELMDWEEAT